MSSLRSSSWFSSLSNRQTNPTPQGRAVINDALVRNFAELSGTVLPNTQGCAFSVKFSPEPNLVGLALADRVCIWDYVRNKQVLEVRDNKDITSQLLWLKSSTSCEARVPPFITASLDRSIRIYEDGKCVASLLDHRDWIRCLALSQPDETRLVSGCISSNLYMWDLKALKPIWTVNAAHQSDRYKELNSINSVYFLLGSEHEFLSGARDGSVRLWDSRRPASAGPCSSWLAHDAKLNVIQVAADNRRLLSSGRDNSVRLWDLRLVGATLFDHDRHVVTGSEEGELVIYSALTGSVVTRLASPSSHVIHLVDSKSDGLNLELVSSSVSNPNFTIWSPKLDGIDESKQTQEKTGSSRPQNAFSAWRRRTAEDVMTRFGDKILALFHKYNFTFSNNWGDLINLIRRDPNNQEATQMLSEMNELFAQSLRTELERAAQLSRGQIAVPDPMRQPGPTGRHFSNYPEDGFEDDYDDDDDDEE